ncbi:MAG: sugar phosphate isomerase/epimerase [Nitrospirae bacterium]|nr:sugar phosphate isomerase/epimerase [Nitrospirota bacterium]
MPLGYGVLSNDTIDGYSACGIVQISVFKEWGGTVREASRLAGCCRDIGLRYAIHPVGFYLSETRDKERAETLAALRELAAITGTALIVHDEGTPWGSRLEGIFAEAYAGALKELSRISPVSIENAHDTPNVKWFWGRYAKSITLDIGHVEAAGMDSLQFVEGLGEEIIEKIDFVHIHRCNGHRKDGSNDHWGLDAGCRELKALGQLLNKKSAPVDIIIEVIEKDQILSSLKLIESVMEDRCS